MTSAVLRLRRPFILGGIDGTITSFAVVAGGAAGELTVGSVLSVGAASVVADGFSMGVSEYTSVSADLTDPSLPSAVASGVACFLAFVVFGCVPLAVYVLTDGVLTSCALLGVAELVLLGVLRAPTEDDRHRATRWGLLASVGQTTALGTAAGAIAYAVGHVAR